MTRGYQVVDLFAGPGGLAEGFSSFSDQEGHSPFNVVVSVEKEKSAHKTLQLRAFLRQFDGDYPPEYYHYLNEGGGMPDWKLLYPSEWANAADEALHLELGTEDGDELIHERVRSLAASGQPAIVIGGPPCQAYSLAGRSRNAGKTNYVPEDDARHFLYQEYIDILDLLKPAAFVMENVKGMLSSSVDGGRIFDRVLTDLRSVGGDNQTYRLFAVGRSPNGKMTLQRADAHSDYIIRSERFGVPQARHRVIVVGVRTDLAKGGIEHQEGRGGVAPISATFRHVLAGLPRLRSGLTRNDSQSEWLRAVKQQMSRVRAAVAAMPSTSTSAMLLARIDELQSDFQGASALPRHDDAPAKPVADCPPDLADFLTDPLLHSTQNHSARSHMEDDLGRYFFAAVFGEVLKRTPKSIEFPPQLAPAHINWSTGKFADRFRVQRWDVPATTVTSHIAKDGHYFIHPDPLQCRALTVREAARLQTFPDNYSFLGNRTEQYVQVGNAVPPYLARQIASALWAALPRSNRA